MQTPITLSTDQTCKFSLLGQGDTIVPNYQWAVAYVVCRFGDGDVTIDDVPSGRRVTEHLDSTDLRGVALKVWGKGAEGVTISIKAGPNGFTGDLHVELTPR